MTAVKTKVQPHYHIALTSPTRDYAFVALTKAVAQRWMRYFRRYHPTSTADLGERCLGDLCVSLALEVLR